MAGRRSLRLQGLKIKILPASEFRRKRKSGIPSEGPTEPEASSSTTSPALPVLSPYYNDPSVEDRKICKRKKPKNQHSKCAFCLTDGADDEKLGPIFEHSNNSISAHLFCMTFSDNISSAYRNLRRGLVGFKLADIREQLRQAEEEICDFCFTEGATVTCSYPGCHRIYHFPCGLDNGIRVRFMSQFLTICDQHEQTQLQNAKSNSLNDSWSWKSSVPNFSLLFDALHKQVYPGVKVKDKRPKPTLTEEQRRKQRFLKYLDLDKNQICSEVINVDCNDRNMLQLFQLEIENAETFPVPVNVNQIKTEQPDFPEVEDPETMTYPALLISTTRSNFPQPTSPVRSNSSEELAMPILSPQELHISNMLLDEESFNEPDIHGRDTLSNVEDKEPQEVGGLPLNGQQLPSEKAAVPVTPVTNNIENLGLEGARVAPDMAQSLRCETHENTQGQDECSAHSSSSSGGSMTNPGPATSCETMSLPLSANMKQCIFTRETVEIFGETYDVINGKIQRSILDPAITSEVVMWKNDFDNPRRILDLPLETRLLCKL